MKLKENALKIALGVCLIVGVLSGKTLATSKANTLTEEKVQAIVQEQVTSAVQGAVAEFKAEEEAKEAEKAAQEQEDDNKSSGVGLIAAAVATGLACIGAGIAVAVVASSAVGAISENPSLLGKTVIFAGLAEGIAIYGLIISIMILNKI